LVRPISSISPQYAVSPNPPQRLNSQLTDVLRIACLTESKVMVEIF